LVPTTVRAMSASGDGIKAVGADQLHRYRIAGGGVGQEDLAHATRTESAIDGVFADK
jgi:hypothetical protein